MLIFRLSMFELWVYIYLPDSFSTKSNTFNVIIFHESFNVLSIFRVKIVFYSSDHFLLKIVKFLYSI